MKNENEIREADFNRFSIRMTLGQALSCSHAGQCDDDIDQLIKDQDIIDQLKAINPEDIRAELKEHGAWDQEELADDDENQKRILWISAGDIRDQESFPKSEDDEYDFRNDRTRR